MNETAQLRNALEASIEKLFGAKAALCNVGEYGLVHELNPVITRVQTRLIELRADGAVPEDDKPKPAPQRLGERQPNSSTDPAPDRAGRLEKGTRIRMKHFPSEVGTIIGDAHDHLSFMLPKNEQYAVRFDSDMKLTYSVSPCEITVLGT